MKYMYSVSMSTVTQKEYEWTNIGNHIDKRRIFDGILLEVKLSIARSLYRTVSYCELVSRGEYYPGHLCIW